MAYVKMLNWEDATFYSRNSFFFYLSLNVKLETLRSGVGKGDGIYYK